MTSEEDGSKEMKDVSERHGLYSKDGKFIKTTHRLLEVVLDYLKDPDAQYLQILVAFPPEVGPEDKYPTIPMRFRSNTSYSDLYHYLVKPCQEVSEVKSRAVSSGAGSITKAQRQWLVAEERILRSVCADLKNEFWEEYSLPMFEWFQSPAGEESIWKRHIQNLAMRIAKTTSLESLKWEHYFYAASLENLKPCIELLMKSEDGNPNGMLCLLSVSGIREDECKSQYVFPFTIKEEYSKMSSKAISEELRKESKKFLLTEFKLDVEVNVNKILRDVFDEISKTRPFYKETLILIETKTNGTDYIATMPGGKRRLGESSFECACREAKEETGFDLHKRKRWKFWKKILHADKTFIYIMVDAFPPDSVDRPTSRRRGDRRGERRGERRG